MIIRPQFFYRSFRSTLTSFRYGPRTVTKFRPTPETNVSYQRMHNSSSNPDLAAQDAQLRQSRATERLASSSSPPLQRRHSLLSSQYSQEYPQPSPEHDLENGLGTWAERQQVFSHIACEEDQEENFDKGARHRGAVFGGNSNLPNAQGSNEINNNSALQSSNTPEDLIQSAEVAPMIDSLHPRQQSAESINEDADIQAAWKWRFSRKWQKEQLRQLEGTTSMEPGDDDDEWSTALDYMAAGGLNLQFGRTTSSIEESGSTLDPTLSQSMSLLLEASLPRGDVSLIGENRMEIEYCFLLLTLFS